MIAATGIIGVVAVTKLTKKGIEKTSESVNRLKYKLLVKDKLQDNPNLLAIVDDLDEDELRTMVNVFERIDKEPTDQHFDSFFKTKIDSIKQHTK